MSPVRHALGAVSGILPLWAVMALAATSIWPIYQSSRFVLLAVVAIGCGTLVAVLGAVLAWRSWLVLVVTVGVFALIGVPLAVPERALFGVLPSAEGMIDLVAGVALGWRQLLTISLPAGEFEALLVPALVLLLGGTVAAGSIAFRARRAEFAAVVPVGVVAVAILFGPGPSWHPLLMGAGTLVAAVAWASRLRWRRIAPRVAGTSERRVLLVMRRVAAGVLVFAIAGAGGVWFASAVPLAQDRVVLRDLVAQPFDPRDHSSPLSGFRSFLRAGEADRELMRVTGLPEGARVRLAALDSYDGVVYAVGSATVDSASGTFVRVPDSINRAGTPGDRHTVTFEIEGYSGVWLPSVGMMERVRVDPRAASDSAELAFNPFSGTAVNQHGVAAGDRYQVEAVVSEPVPLAELATIVPGAARVPRTVDAPVELVATLDQYIEGRSSVGAQLVAAIEGMRAEGYISHGGPDEVPSRSGHSLDRIAELFTAEPMVGDAEQYAVAAALMASHLGFAARVVVGFAPEPQEMGTATVVTGRDVSAWIEVGTARHGWVAIDPVPPVRPIPDEQPAESAPVTRPDTVLPPPPEQPELRDEIGEPDSAAEESQPTDDSMQTVFAVLRGVGIVALVIVLVLAPFLLILGAKLRRRQLRRNAPTARDRIRGGWDEFADLVVDHGLEPPPSATRSEFAAAVGTLPSRVLAAVVDRADFAPDAPGDADADRVWTAVGELRTALGAGRTRRARIRAAISVRSLGGGTMRELLHRQGKQP